jgi:hypothetical protein
MSCVGRLRDEKGDMMRESRRVRFPAFERQDSPQTLADGIAEYHAANPGLTCERDMSPEAREFFRCHDAAHVVFGCSTALDDEAVVKIASIFGTTAGLGVLRGYRLHESVEIYKQLRVAEVLRSIVHAAIVVPRAVLRCVRQRRRWPWSEHGQYLQVPLRELRREFGIRVAHGDAGGAPLQDDSPIPRREDQAEHRRP